MQVVVNMNAGGGVVALLPRRYLGRDVASSRTVTVDAVDVSAERGLVYDGAPR